MPRTSPGLDDEHLCSGLVIPTLSRDPPLATLREIVSVVIDLLIQHTETTYNAIQNDIQPTDSAGTPAIQSLTTNESYGTMTLPLIPSGPQHSPFKRSRLDSTARSSNCALRRRKLADIGRRPPAPWTTTQLKRLQEAAAVHHSKRLPLPQLSPAGNVISSTPTGISRLPRAAKRPAPVQHYPTLPGVDRIHHYLGQQPNHVLGLGPSGHPGAGLGIWALSPLPFGSRGTSWKDNILCQYGGRRLPLAFIEHQDYHTDYAIGWPRFNEGIDGQLDSADSIGHFINDDFSRDGGSLQPHRDPTTKKTYLCLVEDIPYGDEPSFAYGADFWHDKLLQLLPQSRLACIRKYKFAPDHLLSLGLGPDGHPMTTQPDADLPLSPPPLTALERWLAPRAPTTREVSGNAEVLSTVNLHTAPDIKTTATDPETPGTGPVCWSLVRGVMDSEETLRSEDDSHCSLAGRTPTILAEPPPPPPATRQTGSQSLAPGDEGLFSVRVQSAQESPPAGDQLGMGDLADEEALCRMDDSHSPGLRTHPMLAVPPPPLPASCRENSLALDSPPPRTHSNLGDPQVNERGRGRFGYWWAGSLPYDSAGSMEGPCPNPIGQDPIPRLPVDSGREGDGKGDSPSRTAVPGEGGTGRTPPSLVVSAVGFEAREPISPVLSWEGDGTEPSSEPDQRLLLQSSRHSDPAQDPPVAPAIRVGGTEFIDEALLAPSTRAGRRMLDTAVAPLPQSWAAPLITRGPLPPLTVMLPAQLFRRNIVLELPGLRIWIHDRINQGIQVRLTHAAADLAFWLQHSGIRLACAAYVPHSLGDVCSPNGACGLQFGALVALCHSQYPATLPPDWYFQQPERHSLFLQTLQSWLQAPLTPNSTRRKVEGTLDWIARQPDYLTGRHPTLASHHWFTIGDVLGVLPPPSQVTMWGEPENSSLPGWADWMILEGSSESGDGEQLTIPALITALQPERFNGILRGAHFRVWKTPPLPLAGLHLRLAHMLLQDFTRDRSDTRTRPTNVYTTLRSTIPLTSQEQHPRIILVDTPPLVSAETLLEAVPPSPLPLDSVPATSWQASPDLRQRSLQSFLRASDTRTLHSQLSPFAPVFRPPVAVKQDTLAHVTSRPSDPSMSPHAPLLGRACLSTDSVLPNSKTLIDQSLPSGPTSLVPQRRKRTRKRQKSTPKPAIGLNPSRLRPSLPPVHWGKASQWTTDDRLVLPRTNLQSLLDLETLPDRLHGRTALAAHLLHHRLQILPLFTGDLAPLLAVVVSYSKGNASAASIWTDALTVGERQWDQAILRHNGTGKSLCQLAGGPPFAPELLENSLLTPGKHTLLLGCLTLSLQIGLTVFSELGERMARFAPDVNPGAFRRLTRLSLISSNDKLHGTIALPDAPTTLNTCALSCRRDDPVADPPPAYWIHQSNLPTTLPFAGVHVGKPSGSGDIIVATLNVDGIDGKKFEEILAFMDIRKIGIMVLQDTRCPQSQVRWLGEQLRKRLGRQAKLFNVEGRGICSSSQLEKSNHIKVGGQMFLTNHALGIYTHDFSPDPTGLGVLSSITISSKEAGLGVKVIGTYWPPANNLEGSLGQRLLAAPAFQHHALKQGGAGLTPKDYIQTCIDKISDSYCSKPHHLAILAGDLNCSWEVAPDKTAGSHGKGLRDWANSSSWRHPSTILGLGRHQLGDWVSHFSRDGCRGTSWIDHVLTKGSAPIKPIALSIDQSSFWINISDHRPVVLSLSAPPFRRLHHPSVKGGLQFPRHDVKPDFYSISDFQHTMLAQPRPDLPPNADIADCQRAFSTVLAVSASSLPKRSKLRKKVRSPHKDGWSPFMASLKAQMSMLHRIQTNIGTGKLGTKGKWNTPEKREAGIIQATTTWENLVKALRWPKSRGQPSIDPKVWTFGTSVGDWRSLDFAHPQSIRQRCIVDLRIIKRASPGRKRTEWSIRASGTRAKIEAARKQGKWQLAFNSILGTGDMNASAMEDIQYNHPITGDPGWYPSTASELHSVLQNYFRTAFSSPAPSAGPDAVSPLTWASLQSWPDFRAHCAHHHIPDYEETSILKQLWKALTNVKKRELVEEELSSLHLQCPSFSEFEACLKMKSGGTAGGPTGTTYHTVKMWPNEWKQTAYESMAGFWRLQHIPTEWKWRWLVPLLKKEGTTVDDLRPIMLLDVLRKVWTTLVMGNITKVLLKHRVLRVTQHAYLPHRGTDSANIQVVNTLEAAFAEKRSLYGSSWDIRKAFDSVGKWLIRLAWRRLGVPEPLANWLILLDLNNHTVVRTGHSFSCWLKDGLSGLEGLDFNAEMGCGQGDVSSPLTWVAVFDILLSVLEEDDPHGGFRLRKANGDQYAAPDVCFADDLQSFAATLAQLQRKAELVSGFAAVTGMRIAEHKLRTYHVSGQQDAYQDGRTPRGLWIYSSSWRPTWVPFKHEHCFKSLGVWYDTTASADATQLAIITKELHTIIRQVHRARGSAASLSGVLRGAVIAKVAYYGGLSQWSLEDTKRLDLLFAREYNRISKNMTTSQHESLFQPTSSGGHGFPRLSNVIQDRKLALLERIRQHGDHYTRWAADSIMHRGSNSLPDGTLSLTKVCPGYWISSLIEYSLEGNCALATGPPSPTALASDRLLDPSWRAGLTHSQLKFLHHEGIHSQQDLLTLDISYSRTMWKDTPVLPSWLTNILPTVPPPLLPIPLAVGQMWHVLTSAPLLGSPGTTFSIVSMTHPTTPGAAPTIDVYSWTLEAIQMAPGVTLSLSQHPSCTTHAHADLFPPNCVSRLLQVTSLNSATFRSHTCRKDHRLVRKSCLVSTITRTHPPWVREATLSSLDTSVDERESDRPLPCDVFIGHPHAPSTVQTALNVAFYPLMGVIAHYHTGEWSIQRYTSDRPHTPHPSSYRTLLYALILRAVLDYRDTDANIYVPHKSILPRLCGTAKTPLRHVTQCSLLRRIHDLAGIHILFKAYSPLPRQATFQSSWKLPKVGSFWVSLWRPEFPHPIPAHTAERSLSLLLTPELQGGEWLPYDGLTGELILAPIGSVTDASRRSRALVARDLNRQSRGAPPYWNDNTLCLGARVQCIPEATIQQRGHRIRHLDRRHWSVGSNRIKHLVVDSEAWRQEGHCKLCLVSMDSYDHIYRECPHPDISDTRGRLLEGIRKQNSTLTGNEALLAATLLQLYQEEDGYRIALGDLTTSHRHRLFPIYQNLPHSTVREADALFLRLVRQLNHLRAGIWAERAHILDPAVRPWAEDVPKGSKWYVVHRGHSPGLYPEYDLANKQLHNFSNGRLQGFPDEAAATTAEAQRVSKCARHNHDLLLATATRVISLFTDGSHSKPDSRRGLPHLAGWGYLALERLTISTLHEEYDRVHCDPLDSEYHGATHSSNNTGELTAIGEALTWIQLQSPSTSLSYEICSDSTYALDAIDLTDPPTPPSSNKALVLWCHEVLHAVRQQGHLLLFRKVKAHCTDKSTDTCGNNRADALAELGRREDLDFHLTLGVPLLSLIPPSPPAPEPADSLPFSPATTVVPPKPPPAWTRLPGWEDLWNRPSPAPYNLDDDFLPGDGSPLTTLPARSPFSRTSRQLAFDGEEDSNHAPRRHRSPSLLVSPVRPRYRMRDSALEPCVRKRRRLAAGCLDAPEPDRPPTEGTPEKPMTLVDSVARKTIAKSHPAEAFVSQDVVGE